MYVFMYVYPYINIFTYVLLNMGFSADLVDMAIRDGEVFAYAYINTYTCMCIYMYVCI
jgi:hypothetical protein